MHGCACLGACAKRAFMRAVVAVAACAQAADGLEAHCQHLFRRERVERLQVEVAIGEHEAPLDPHKRDLKLHHVLRLDALV